MAEEQATETINMRITPAELDGIDEVRGAMPRGAWIKALARAAVNVTRKAGEPCELRVDAYPTGGESSNVVDIRPQPSPQSDYEADPEPQRAPEDSPPAAHA